MRIKVTGETDELYYLHGDHAGSTVLLTDVDGVPAGRAIYDAGWRLGGIITSTFSVTLVNRLDGGQPFDALTNLTYHGNGRYYDPLLGLEVQPRWVGGAPLLPQASNPYLVPSQGSAMYESGLWWMDGIVDMGVDVVVDLMAVGTGKALGPAFGALWSRLVPLTQVAKRTALLQVTASRPLINALNNKGEAFFTRVGNKGQLYRSTYRVNADSSVLADYNRKLAAARAPKGRHHKDLGFVDIQEEFSTPYDTWGKRLLRQEHAALLGGKFTGADLIESAAVGFVFDFGLEYARLAGEPFLKEWQKAGRAAIVGLSGVGWGTVVILTVGTGPAGFVVSLLVGWTIESWTADAVIDLVPGLDPVRQLQPLP